MHELSTIDECQGHEIQINFFTKKDIALAECNFSRGAGFARQRSRQELPEWAHDDPQGESGSFDHEVINLYCKICVLEGRWWKVDSFF